MVGVKAQEAWQPLSQICINKIREEAFRIGYGYGAEATQREAGRREFLVEDEAVKHWLSP